MREHRVGLNFRYKRTRCTGKYKDRPLLEVRWTTEEGAYSLDDLIAGALENREQRLDSPVRAEIPWQSRLAGPPACWRPIDARETVVVAEPAAGSGLALRRMAVRVEVVRDDPGEAEADGAPNLLDKRV